jgi:prolipoprotein diacylglyceryltransferase
MPAARVIARMVEGKNNTFTVAGASFVGLLAAPWVIQLLNAVLGSRLGFALPLVESLGVLAIAYAFGEGTGRLACMSFGCCYGRPLPRGMTWWTKLLGQRCVAFSGATKKVAYEAGLERVPLVPIQSMTAMFDVGAGLLGLTLFLNERASTAFLCTTLLTQLWRVAAEMLRADYRGRGAISTYQIMAVVACLYALILFILLPADWKGAINIVAGLHLLWHPGVIVWLQAVWAGTFLYTGCSRVTAARISFLVLRDRI